MRVRTRPVVALVVLVLLALGACRCNSNLDGGDTPDARVGDGPRADQLLSDQGPAGEGGPGGWVVLAEESFESTTLPSASWTADSYPDDGPFSDDGIYFQDQAITPPAAYRISAPFGASNWLTVEAYSRSNVAKLSDLLALVNDPAGGTNRVLRLTSPAHTDATVIRPSQALPARYRISLRVGYPQFGDGQPGSNGYDSGNETPEPWLQGDATEENGFYWLAILDSTPRPHNNVWIHHHRKVVIDSDNHYPPWMEIYDGSSFVSSGVNPVMIFAVDGKGQGWEGSGKPFLSYAAGTWQPSGEVRAADSYKPGTWYKVTVQRFDNSYTLEVSGDFKHGGQQTYSATIDAAANCVWHYNNAALPASSPCIDTGHYPSLDGTFPHWPSTKGYPDYFMFGDPHNNYYEGFVHYDDLRLEVWKP